MIVDHGKMKVSTGKGDPMLKIDSWPQATVIIAGLFTVAGLIAFLVWSGWDVASIAGAAAAVAGLFAGQYATTRKASAIDAKQDAQSAKLDRVVRQTNGEMRAAIDSAVTAGVARGVAAGLAAARKDDDQ